MTNQKIKELEAELATLKARGQTMAQAVNANYDETQRKAMELEAAKAALAELDAELENSPEVQALEAKRTALAADKAAAGEVLGLKG